MQLSAVMAELEANVENQLGLAGRDVSRIGGRLMAALRPAVRQALLSTVRMAAAEISPQLTGQRVEVRHGEEDPELLVVDEIPAEHTESDSWDARLTLRLPANLKDLVAEAADLSGKSINSYVIQALKSQSRTRRGATRTQKRIDL